MSKPHLSTYRVRYHETDGQRRVHNSNYLNYFEQGRVEMLRDAGLSYKEFENAGLMLVVTEMNIKYHNPAEFDDLLTLETTLIERRRVRLRHGYRMTRGDDLIVEGESVIACVGKDGKPKKLPEHLDF